MKHIPHFFIPAEELSDPTATLRGADLKHLSSVLRLKPGDRAYLLDGLNHRYMAELVSVDKERALLALLSKEEVTTEPKVRVTLGMALLKGERFEWVIQKAVELGVSRILPFTSARTVVSLSQEKARGRVERWRKIAQEAAEQSERGKVPTVAEPDSFEQLCSLKGFDLKMICAEREVTRRMKDLIEKGSLPADSLVLVGPEGGFTPEEITLAEEKGFVPVSLGKRILRADTAAIASVANLLYSLD